MNTNGAEQKEPVDLRKALTAAPKVLVLWKGLTPIARRDFITWIESAKLPETRKRRIEKAVSMLAAGKRRPCCYAIVPMNFYKALGTSKKVKAQWKNLTPTERRDLVSWVEAGGEYETHRNRVEKACDLLNAGKRRP